MTPDYLRAIEKDGATLSAIAASHPDVMVPSCPGWTVAQLAGHLGQVHSMATTIIATNAQEANFDGYMIEPPAGAEVSRWYDERRAALLDLLEDLDPTTPLWNWTGSQVAAFYPRRMAHETAIHRWDAQSAIDACDPIDADLARDGIDEVIEVSMQHRTGRTDITYPNGSIHLHRTDGDGEWLLRPGDDGGLIVTHEHAKGDVAVRGDASGILLYLWGRGRDGLEVFGDESLADAWGSVSA